MPKAAEPLWTWSACALAEAYRRGEATPLDALRSCLARIDATHPQLNAFVARRDDQAMADAEASTERLRNGQPRSRLDGIPLSIKDNLCTADMPTIWGSLGLRSHPPAPHDELPVARARASGAIIVGKTNVPEFTLEGYTDNPVFGPTRNPWRLALTPGGSSGGAVASVAAGCTPLALGTDGGGSIRRPASHTGLVGFKPSIGAIARSAGLPPLLLDFEVVGPMARSVADARLLFDVLRGPVAEDRPSMAAQAAAQGLPVCAAPWRVLYVPRLLGAPVDSAIAQRCERAIQALTTQGHTVHQGELPLDITDIAQQWPMVGQIGLAHLFDSQPEWAAQASPKYRKMAEQGRAQSATALWQLLAAVERLRADCVPLFERYDLIAMPSAAALPWPATEAFPAQIDGQAVGPRGHAVFTGWVNAAGLPAVSVPTDCTADGLPVGLQLIGPFGADDRVLAAASVMETLHPWTHRRPSLT